MIIINKISVLFINIRFIYGHYSNVIEYIKTFSLSFILIPIYFISISILTFISIILLILYLPFYLVTSSLKTTNGMDDPIMGLLLLPISSAYYGFYITTFIPYLLLGALCDGIAEIISRKNHHNQYVIIWPSVFAVPHKEYYGKNDNY